MNNPLIKKIISGGQTGADMGGLLAGKALNIPTGGYAPRGWKTERGPQKELLKSFDLEEWPAFGYSARTFANVNICDATLIVGNINSPGSLLTKKYCTNNKKPYFAYNPRDFEDNLSKHSQVFRLWLIRHSIEILNVAGNRESKNPGIEDFIRRFLIEALRGEAL